MNRQIYRDLLVAQFAALIAPGQVQTVTGHKLATMDGLAPVIHIKSAGSGRVRENFEDNTGTFYFDVLIYVQRNGWTDAEACNMVDLLEWLVAENIDANRDSYYVIDYIDRSKVEEIEDSGAPYYKETIPLRVTTT